MPAPKEEVKPEEAAKEEAKAEAEKPAAKEEHKEEVAAAEKPKEEAAEKMKLEEKAEAKKEEKAEAKQAEKKAEPVAAAVAESEAPKGPRIAIIIAGAGLSRSSTEQAFKLPAQVSLSFSPYAADVADWIKKATEGRHEIYVDVPMEPKDYPLSDPGPYALMVNLDDDKNLERLEQVLKSGVGYRGLVSGPDERFTESSRAMEWLFNTLLEKKKKIFFVARAGNKQISQDLDKSKLPAQGIDFVLDEKLTNEAIDEKLSEAEALAQKSGFAVVLARPYPISTQRIQEWIKTLEPKGIHLVPLSQAKPK